MKSDGIAQFEALLREIVDAALSRNCPGFLGEPLMPQFMLIAGGADVDKRSGNNPKLAPVMLERYMAWIQGLRDSGRFMGSYKLHDQTGRRLTIRGGEVIDGPFIESKDAIGGIFVIDAASLDEATELARSCPCLDLQNGYMEVRVIEVARPDAR